MTDVSAMKLLAATAVLTGVALVAGVFWSAGVVEARVRQGLEIDGTVRVEGTREPVPGVDVYLHPGHGPAAIYSTEGADHATSGPDGRFRFSGLEPGEYALDVRAPGVRENQFRDATYRDVTLGDARPLPEITLWVAPEHVEMSGRVTDWDGRPISGVRVSVEGARLAGQSILRSASIRSALTDADGSYDVPVYPGTYYLKFEPPPENESVWTEYYPGYLDSEDAVPVTLRPGSNLPGMNISLDEQALYRVRFRLPLPEYLPGLPEPLSTYVIETNDDPTNPIPRAGPAFDLWIRPLEGPSLSPGPVESLTDDTYLTRALPPGEYEMRLFWPTSLTTYLRSEFGVDMNPYDPIAQLRFTIEDQDLDLGRLPEVPRVDVRGRIVVRRDSSAATHYPGDLPVVTLLDRVSVFGKTAVGTDDGAFQVEAVYPGRFTVQLNPQKLPDGWYVASLRSGPVDLLRDELVVGGQVSPIEVALASDGGRITGAVRDAKDQLVPTARVILVPPADRRGVVSVFPATIADPSGTFTIGSIPPGDYRLLALDTAGLDNGVSWWNEPNFLRQYELRGERITVDPGARMRVDAQAIPIYE